MADEICDFNVVSALRAAGYDVVAVGENTTWSVDRELIQQANHENRILLTEDKDFGWLVYVSAAESAGVILIRFPVNIRESLPETIVKLVKEHDHQIPNAFIVVQPGYIRIRHSLWK